MRGREKRTISQYLGLILLAICILTVCAPLLSAQNNQAKKVLVLNSYHPGFAWSDGIMEGIRSKFKASGQNIEIDIEYMDTKRIHDEIHYQNLYESYKHKFSKRDYDLILTSDDNAFNFMLNYHDELFPGNAVVFCGLNSLDKFLEDKLSRLGWITGSVEMYDIQGNLDLILKLHPDVKQIVVISDKTVSSQKCKRKVQEAARAMPVSMKFNYLKEDAYMEDILAQLKVSPPGSIVLLMSFFKDREGKYYTPEAGGKMISENSSVPVYSAWDFYLGHGITGGLISSSNAQGEMGARIALRIVNGENISDIPVSRESANYYVFDYNELKRFGIKIHKLPKDSIFINKPRTFYSEHKGLIWSAIVSTAVLVLIIFILASNIIIRRRAEESLLESEEHYRTLSEQSTDAIYITTRKGELSYINRSFLGLFGYTKEELEDLKAQDLYVNPDERSMFREEIEKKGFVKDFELKLRKKDGAEMDCLLTTSVRRADDRSILGYQGIIRDITERKRLEAQFQQSQKMEAIGILAGGVAHDFNNILTAIQGYTDLAMMKLDEADPLYRDLKQIDLSAGRAASLTRQLLLFSRRQPMEFTPINLNTTVENLLKMLQRLIGEDISINTELDPELWTVQADTGSIEQAIMNLTVNARDAMPEGGALTIKTQNIHIDKDYCKTYTYAHPGRFVCLTIEDTGVGMDKETIQRIFEPFFSTKGTGKGTGLGLSVVHGIVKQHEGWVNVYSEPGQGSTLKIYLPSSFLKVEDESKETVLLKDLQGSGERILLVEDEKEVREFTTRALGENGYDVYEAASAEEALDIFEKEAGSFDLIFSDVILPDKTGIQLVDQLLSRKGELRILLSSGYTDHKSQWPVIRERKFRFLQKPYALTDLFRAIRDAIGQDS